MQHPVPVTEEQYWDYDYKYYMDLNQQYKRLLESEKGINTKGVSHGDPAEVLWQIAAEQSPAREERRLASMWYILVLMFRDRTPEAHFWSLQLLGDTVPSDVVEYMGPNHSDFKRFRAIEKWEHALNSRAINVNMNM